MPTSRKLLVSGLEAMGLELTEPQHDKLIEYLQLLLKWNEHFNLTSVRDEQEAVHRHLLDSLACVQYLEGEHYLDVGSGAGLPGIPISIALPDARVDCMDSNGKKTRFIRQAVSDLGLNNVAVIQSRVEEFRFELGYDAVLSRAFSDLPQMLALCGHLCRSGGRFYAMKGVDPREETAVLGKEYIVSQLHKINVPGLEEQRHLVVIERMTK